MYNQNSSNNLHGQPHQYAPGGGKVTSSAAATGGMVEPSRSWMPPYPMQNTPFQQQGWYGDGQNPTQNNLIPGPSPGQPSYSHPAVDSQPSFPPHYQQQSPFIQGQTSNNQDQISPLQTQSAHSSLTSPSLASNETPEKQSTHESTSSAAPLRVDRPGPGMANKKKRKKLTSSAEPPVVTPSSPPADFEKEKRAKTGRACDACRTKKIRCDILLQVEAGAAGEAHPICAHCKQYELECTFFLPITETRFKKKKVTEGTGTNQSLPLATEVMTRGPTGNLEMATYAGRGPSSSETGHPPPDTAGRVEGPTSINFLLHTTVPTIASEAYDLRHHNSWEVLEDGNGLIRVRAPATAAGQADADFQDLTTAHNRLNKPLLSAQTMSLLVNAYFSDIAPLFPIISRQEFATKPNPGPLLLYAICGLGATRRQFPREVFAGLRGVINGLLRSNDVLSDAKFENVQALLLLAQVGDLHAQPTAATASASLVRTGAAVRMAQDIGLHRESAMRPQSAQDISYIELRRRVWATCVIMDRWYGAALGIPLLIDLLDCDVLLPAPYDLSAGGEPSTWPLDTSYMALTEHLKLSILLGRVLKTIYSPTGLKHASDAQLQTLLNDMTHWKNNLPEQLQFRGSSTSAVAGLLHLGHAAVQFLFWRVFMRITHVCPPHLSFAVSVEHWSKLINWSREALGWLDKNDDALDTIFVYPYAATSCALIQYHTWARRKDPQALETLRLVKETAQRWEGVVQPDQMSIRRKTCETMTLLYDAALKTNPDSSENTRPVKLPANPTAGVTARPEGFSELKFLQGNDWAGGGKFVARNLQQKEQAGLPDGDVLIAPGGEHDRDRANEAQVESGNVQAQKDSDTNANRQVDHQNSLQDYTNSGLARPILANPQAMRQEPANNVNPQLNFDEGQIHSIFDPFHNHHPYQNDGTNIEINPTDTGTGPVGGGVEEYTFDPSFLDSLPTSSFDWESWSNFFDKTLP